MEEANEKKNPVKQSAEKQRKKKNINRKAAQSRPIFKGLRITSMYKPPVLMELEGEHSGFTYTSPNISCRGTRMRSIVAMMQITIRRVVVKSCTESEREREVSNFTTHSCKEVESSEISIEKKASLFQLEHPGSIESFKQQYYRQHCFFPIDWLCL